ncbi:MAG: MSHA biogenesis protein MshG [Sedimenticola sp.]|nr:MAG: MSHA biogenesis protein MshG [Sedimenticola sp.]
MPQFQYTARNRRGEPMDGLMEADSPEAVAEQLFNTNLTPIDIRESAGRVEVKAKGGLISQWLRPRVKLDELIMLCRQFYTLQKSGVPILRGLTSLSQTTNNATLSTTLQSISDDIQSGREFHVALAKFPHIFSQLFVSLIRVGQSTGKLDEAFMQLAGYLELEKLTRDRIKSATRYPTIVLIAIVMALAIINIWVIPAFADAFARFDAELPWATQVLIATSDFTVKWWREMLITGIAALFAIRFWMRTDKGEYFVSRYLLKIPLVGNILLKATLGRFARSLAIALESGVPMVHALTVIAGVVNNAYVSERILSMRDGIESGDSIARTAAATGLFTPLVLQMIAIGEETGAVDSLLRETAEHYEREVEYELKRLADAIEPIIIVIIGIMVLILALGVFLPMWDLSTAVRGN